MKDIKTAVAKPRRVALYANTDTADYYTVMETRYVRFDERFTMLPDGQEREYPIQGFVRVSEPVAVEFTAISDDAIVQNAVATLDEEERKTIADLNTKLAQIRERKSQLLSLTHQPEVCETCKGRRFYTKHFPGNESSPAWDADDQPCPDCNPNGEGVAP